MNIKTVKWPLGLQENYYELAMNTAYIVIIYNVLTYCKDYLNSANCSVFRFDSERMGATIESLFLLYEQIRSCFFIK